MQELQAYLSQRPGAASRGWSARRWSCDWTRPSISRRSGSLCPRTHACRQSAVNAVHGADGMLAASLPDTDLSGFYEARLTRTNGTAETRRYAVNVDPAEGDLATSAASKLRRGWRASSISSSRPRRSNRASSDLSGHNLGETVLYALDPAVDRRADFGVVGQLPSGVLARTRACWQSSSARRRA